MLKIKRSGMIAAILGCFLIGCEEEEAPPELLLPLVGTYTLTEMIINDEAITLRDTLLAFVNPQNGVDSVSIGAGTLILVASDIYTDADTTPIGGTVTLNNNSSATLAGLLPVNWGTGCQPFLLISDLGSDGAWSADTSTGIFTLDLVVDQLDIDGFFTLTGDHLEVIYESTVTNDERIISRVNYNGASVAVTPVCLPVSTVTERVLKLTLIL
ncbi:MAG: hypothetical protein HQ507_13145 [Candidatus Marinimicrobia bacterium]|nr:hypothetical protein [Candidatus Neomarinimicrobiota bacterium]